MEVIWMIMLNWFWNRESYCCGWTLLYFFANTDLEKENIWIGFANPYSQINNRSSSISP
jgi:hypothetical protein